MSFRIDERGIYSISNVYHDDIEVTYHVDLEKGDPIRQLDSFLERIRAEGANRRSQEIGRLLGVTK